MALTFRLRCIVVLPKGGRIRTQLNLSKEVQHASMHPYSSPPASSRGGGAVVAKSLQKSNMTKTFSYYLPPNPVREAKNATGDGYHSDGRLLLIFLAKKRTTNRELARNVTLPC
jgi:hypothetical protein